MTDKSIAVEILKQLGGNKFIVMTGAKNFGCTDTKISFKIGRNSGNINHVSIELKSDDTYTMEFIKIRGAKMKVEKTCEGIYCDMLQAAFTSVTGMDTHL